MFLDQLLRTSSQAGLLLGIEGPSFQGCTNVEAAFAAPLHCHGASEVRRLEGAFGSILVAEVVAQKLPPCSAHPCAAEASVGLDAAAAEVWCLDAAEVALQG